MVEVIETHTAWFKHSEMPVLRGAGAKCVSPRVFTKRNGYLGSRPGTNIDVKPKLA